MAVEMNRRRLILSAASAALIASIEQSTARGFDFGTVLGAVAVGMFPGAAAALGGFEVIKLIGNANDFVGNANGLVEQTKALENHIDSVLNQVSATLGTVQSFVQDCDNALHDIETLIRQLPAALAAAFDVAGAKAAFGKLTGDRANMSAYLNSTRSVIANQNHIQSLCEKIVVDISTMYALNNNMFQFVMQVIPGLTTWMQGYTAYNLCVPAGTRSINPWDHDVVSKIALPPINKLLGSIRSQSTSQSDLVGLPLDSGYLYTFDGSVFTKTTKPFAPRFATGEIDANFYYVIWPEGVEYPQFPGPQLLLVPVAGDLCFLTPYAAGYRAWMIAPRGVAPGPFPPPPELTSAINAAMAFPRQMELKLRTTSAFNQLTEGWQLFDGAVKSQLIGGDRDGWKKMPTLTA